MWLLIFCTCSCSGAIFELNSFDALMYPIRRANEDSLNETSFPSLENYQVNAKQVSESEYHWIAQVVHARTKDYPYMCTASCISERIFVTAARCILSLKVAHTSVVYKEHRLPVMAFVLPLNTTKQAFDDLGLIVVERDHYRGVWSAIELVNKNRTGAGFKWFEEWNLSGLTHFKVIGYATKKAIYRFKKPDRKFDLSELDVSIDINACSTILTHNFQIHGFFVPCYHSCTLQQFNNNEENCKNYLGVEGAAVIDVNNERLLGVATWGPNFSRYQLPVGFSVPNSANFYNDYECAKRIRNDIGVLVSTGFYQSLCLDE